MKYTSKRLKDRTFNFYCGNRVIARGYINTWINQPIITTWDADFHHFCDLFGYLQEFMDAAKMRMYNCESSNRTDFYFPHEYNTNRK